ncbi:ABC transporter ATP-binding protein [Robbsia andropogonis]|uniref:ABC transporter ATP-binding protein n=1 Tax=Robbsia andropogonis TaxID=28092 RepID=UPI0004B1E72C|nr:ABC transporter ATP-binding protein [Robbsia andropogonis]MCP1118177.1 ABC transporter ATP-binding protein [Robbsia andropogonis]MCP1127542.1 ABC transporter ATP-binding protein [Robbsia andropogonis]
MSDSSDNILDKPIHQEGALPIPDENTGISPRLALREVSLRRGTRAILDGISLDVHAGQLITILGASGAGKSTLLRVAAGLLSPNGGHVLVDGQEVVSPRPDVALAFQDPCLLPWLTVHRNVGFGLGFSRQRKLSRHEMQSRIAAALKEVDLTHAAHLAPRQLSGGMAQRVALARCLAREPRTLLLDEPFGALDEVTRADMQRLLVSVVRDTQAATLLVTHDIDEALCVSDRVVVLGRDGALAASIDLTLPHPRDDHVQALGSLRVRVVAALRASMASRPASDIPLIPHSLQ